MLYRPTLTRARGAAAAERELAARVDCTKRRRETLRVMEPPTVLLCHWSCVGCQRERHASPVLQALELSAICPQLAAADRRLLTATSRRSAKSARFPDTCLPRAAGCGRRERSAGWWSWPARRLQKTARKSSSSPETR